jgi:cell filamentation protein, protein adenylyltransferase
MDTSSFQKDKPGKLVRAAQGYWAFVPNGLPPKLDPTWEFVNQISDADRKLSELAGAARTLPNPHLLIGPFTRREAVLSSRIEGTVASLSDLMSFEALGLVHPDRPDVGEVANYVAALEHGLKRLVQLPVSARLMRELHERLMRGTRGEHLTPGEFRRSQNWIGPPGCLLRDATFVPPPEPEMKEALSELEKYINSESSLPPLVRMALIHYQFEAIHPFLDGNGRIGRLLITLLLCAEGLLPQPLLYLSAFFERHRSEYYRLLLQVSTQGNWKEWIMFFLRGVSEQSVDALNRANQLQQLLLEYRQKLHERRSSGTLLKMADLLFKNPVFDVNSLSKALGLTYVSAQKNINKLVQMGILREMTGRKRGRIYIAQSVMDILEKRDARQLRLEL